MQNFWNSPNNYKFLINDEDYVRWLRKSPFHDRKLHLSNKNNFKQAFFLNFVVICTFFSLWNLLIKMKSSSKWITISRFDIGTHFLSKNLRKFHQSIEKWSMELIKNFVFFFSICMTNIGMDAKNPIWQSIRLLTFFVCLTFSFWWNGCKKINV